MRSFAHILKTEAKPLALGFQGGYLFSLHSAKAQNEVRTKSDAHVRRRATPRWLVSPEYPWFVGTPVDNRSRNLASDQNCVLRDEDPAIS